MFRALHREIPWPTSLSPKVFPFLPHSFPALSSFFFFGISSWEIGTHCLFCSILILCQNPCFCFSWSYFAAVSSSTAVCEVWMPLCFGFFLPSAEFILSLDLLAVKYCLIRCLSTILFSSKDDIFTFQRKTELHLKIKRQTAEECKQSLDSFIRVKEEKKYLKLF